MKDKPRTWPDRPCIICGGPVVSLSLRPRHPEFPDWCEDCADCEGLRDLARMDAQARSGKAVKADKTEIFDDFVIPAFALAKVLRYTTRRPR